MLLKRFSLTIAEDVQFFTVTLICEEIYVMTSKSLLLLVTKSASEPAPPAPTPYPALYPEYIIASPSTSSNFFLHTYLVGATAIKKAVRYSSNPALHIAEVRAVEWPSGPSLAEFLMASTKRKLLFIVGIDLVSRFREEFV